ncbi:F-box domain containing protein [Gossypium australe]|uniref:F-box domain containing protein n=1 Tax=Gossypium australe TaxID=47621 RepID=A0A5B6VTS2_9ROSI|nr:F-box domain containing protein [Gossypium australe]
MNYADGLVKGTRSLFGKTDGSQVVKLSTVAMTGKIQKSISTRRWKREVIENTFPEHIAQKIMQIPLAEEAHEDFKVWRGEHTGEFTVRSAYQLL